MASTCPSRSTPTAPASGSPASPAPAGVEQAQPGPAGRAAHRLGVEPPVRRVVVFGGAVRAHREARHRGQRPVIGHITDDREPRPAVRAVDERVPEPPVARVGQLGQAVRAGRAVRRDQGPAAAGRVAGRDREPAVPLGAWRGRSPVPPGPAAALPLDQNQEGPDGVRGPLHLSENAVNIVAHPSGQAEPHGQGVHERAEPDSLDHALHADRRPDALGRPASLFPARCAGHRLARGCAGVIILYGYWTRPEARCHRRQVRVLPITSSRMGCLLDSLDRG